MNSVVSSAVPPGGPRGLKPAARDSPTQPNHHVPAMNRGAILTAPYGANEARPAFLDTKSRLKP